jgi:hypothetical protein
VAAQIAKSFNRTPLLEPCSKTLICEAVMRALYGGILGALLVTGFASSTPAQETRPGQVAPISRPASLTGKERLGRKWMDEQRIDNCNVPVDKRGARPRPSTCSHVPTG